MSSAGEASLRVAPALTGSGVQWKSIEKKRDMKMSSLCKVYKSSKEANEGSTGHGPNAGYVK